MSRSQAEMEAHYDAERNGTLYTKPSDAVWEKILDIISDPNDDGSEDENAVADWIDRQLAGVTVRNSSVEDGCTWTEYSAGDVAITVQHNGYVPSDGTPYMLEICGQDINQPWTLAVLRQAHADLGCLLNDARVLAAFGDAPEDMAAILEEIDGGEKPSTLDQRFDKVIDQVCALPDHQRQRAISLWEGFVAGIAIGNALQ